MVINAREIYQQRLSAETTFIEQEARRHEDLIDKLILKCCALDLGVTYPLDRNTSYQIINKLKKLYEEAGWQVSVDTPFSDYDKTMNFRVRYIPPKGKTHEQTKRCSFDVE